MKELIEYLERKIELCTEMNMPLEKFAYTDALKKARALQLQQTGVSSSAEFKAWDDLFGILAWKFQPTKSGDMYLDGEAVYNELKEKFDLRRK